MRNYFKENISLIITLAIIFISGIILSFFRVPISDEAGYLNSSLIIYDRIINFEWFGNDAVGLHGFFYKFIIAVTFLITGPSILFAGFVNVFISIITLFFIYKLLFNIFNNKYYALSGILLTTSYQFIYSFSKNMVDIYVMLILVVLAIAYHKKSNDIIKGLLILFLLDSKEYIFFMAVPAILLVGLIEVYQKYNFKSLYFYFQLILKYLLLFLPSIIYILLMFYTSIIPLNFIIPKILGLSNKVENTAFVFGSSRANTTNKTLGLEVESGDITQVKFRKKNDVELVFKEPERRTLLDDGEIQKSNNRNLPTTTDLSSISKGKNNSVQNEIVKLEKPSLKNTIETQLNKFKYEIIEKRNNETLAFKKSTLSNSSLNSTENINKSITKVTTITSKNEESTISEYQQNHLKNQDIHNFKANNIPHNSEFIIQNSEFKSSKLAVLSPVKEMSPSVRNVQASDIANPGGIIRNAGASAVLTGKQSVGELSSRVQPQTITEKEQSIISSSTRPGTQTNRTTASEIKLKPSDNKTITPRTSEELTNRGLAALIERERKLQSSGKEVSVQNQTSDTRYIKNEFRRSSTSELSIKNLELSIQQSEFKSPQLAVLSPVKEMITSGRKTQTSVLTNPGGITRNAATTTSGGVPSKVQPQKVTGKEKSLLSSSTPPGTQTDRTISTVISKKSSDNKTLTPRASEELNNRGLATLLEKERQLKSSGTRSHQNELRRSSTSELAPQVSDSRTSSAGLRLQNSEFRIQNELRRSSTSEFKSPQLAVLSPVKEMITSGRKTQTSDITNPGVITSNATTTTGGEVPSKVQLQKITEKEQSLLSSSSRPGTQSDRTTASELKLKSTDNKNITPRTSEELSNRGLAALIEKERQHQSSGREGSVSLQNQTSDISKNIGSQSTSVIRSGQSLSESKSPQLAVLSPVSEISPSGRSAQTSEITNRGGIIRNAGASAGLTGKPAAGDLSSRPQPQTMNEKEQSLLSSSSRPGTQSDRTTASELKLKSTDNKNITPRTSEELNNRGLAALIEKERQLQSSGNRSVSSAGLRLQNELSRSSTSERSQSISVNKSPQLALLSPLKEMRTSVRNAQTSDINNLIYDSNKDSLEKPSLLLGILHDRESSSTDIKSITSTIKDSSNLLSSTKHNQLESNPKNSSDLGRKLVSTAVISKKSSKKGLLTTVQSNIHQNQNIKTPEKNQKSKDYLLSRSDSFSKNKKDILKFNNLPKSSLKSTLEIDKNNNNIPSINLKKDRNLQNEIEYISDVIINNNTISTSKNIVVMNTKKINFSDIDNIKDVKNVNKNYPIILDQRLYKDTATLRKAVKTINDKELTKRIFNILNTPKIDTNLNQQPIDFLLKNEIDELNRQRINKSQKNNSENLNSYQVVKLDDKTSGIEILSIQVEKTDVAVNNDDYKEVVDSKIKSISANNIDDELTVTEKRVKLFENAKNQYQKILNIAYGYFLKLIYPTSFSWESYPMFIVYPFLFILLYSMYKRNNMNDSFWVLIYIFTLVFMFGFLLRFTKPRYLMILNPFIVLFFIKYIVDYKNKLIQFIILTLSLIGSFASLYFDISYIGIKAITYIFLYFSLLIVIYKDIFKISYLTRIPQNKILYSFSVAFASLAFIIVLVSSYSKSQIYYSRIYGFGAELSKVAEKVKGKKIFYNDKRTFELLKFYLSDHDWQKHDMRQIPYLNIPKIRLLKSYSPLVMDYNIYTLNGKFRERAFKSFLSENNIELIVAPVSKERLSDILYTYKYEGSFEPTIDFVDYLNSQSWIEPIQIINTKNKEFYIFKVNYKDN